MTEELFRALCRTCDRLLLASDSTVERVAIPWLHIIRPHPNFDRKYEEACSLSFVLILKKITRNLASIASSLAKALTHVRRYSSVVEDLPITCDVLLVSHLLNDSFLKRKHDFYFDNIPEQLAEQKVSAVIALINHSKVSLTQLTDSWSKAGTVRIILSSALNITNELKLHVKCLRSAWRLWKTARTAASKFDRRIATYAALEANSGGAQSALRIGQQIGRLVQRLQPKAIVITFEGHAWERIVFAAARAHSPAIKCIGYQHSVLFNLQHAIQRKLSAEYNPDVILTSGRIAQMRLRNNPNMSSVPIKILGSNRDTVSQDADNYKSIKQGRLICLVLPEGLLSECNLLFEFSLKCARLEPDIDFIWRLHPSVSYRDLSRKNPEFRNLPSNIALSKYTLPEDVAVASWVLYRGSTAVVQAVIAGVQPIYLHQTNEISIDPLYGINLLTKKVTQPEEFLKLVRKKSYTTNTYELAREHCQQLFTPINIAVLVGCLTSKGKAA